MVLHFQKACLALIGKDISGNSLKTKETNFIWPIAIAILLCIGIWSGGMLLTHWYAINYFSVPKEANSPALFGDSFGAVNALISAFAFAGVIVSMYLQRKDLEMQRESIDIQRDELQQNTKELELQRKEFENQNKTMRLQRFENTFFNMLSLQQEITNNIKSTKTKKKRDRATLTIKEEKTPCSGREVFEQYYDEANKLQTKDASTISTYINSLYHFDHYFLHLYRIIKFVDESNLIENEVERYKYISILRATLSRYELVFLFYNELNPRFAHFKSLIEKYSIFDNLNEKTLILTEEEEDLEKLLRLYTKSAYKPEIKGYNK
jgi:hypothetical protein